MSKFSNEYVENALSKFKKEISSGKYKVGSFLPSERQLCEKFEVGRGTARTLLKKLMAENLVRFIPERGYLVLDEQEDERIKRFLFLTANAGLLVASYEGIGILSGICKSANEYNAEVTISFADNRIFRREVIPRLQTGDLQGVIIHESADYKNIIVPLEKKKIPYVIANLESHLKVVTAKVDFRDIGRRAGRHLVELGHRNIGVINGPSSAFIFREILAGLRGALAEDEIILDKRFVCEADVSMEFARISALKLLSNSNRPTAIFAARDIRASGVYQACRELNLRIPQDLSVISYDNISWPESERMGLTTFEEPVEEMGAAAVDMLSQWIKIGKKPANTIFKCKLISRSSTAQFKHNIATDPNDTVT